MRTENLEIQEAVDRAASILKSSQDLFLSTKANFPSSWGTDLLSYVDRLALLAAGTAKWGYETLRYFGKKAGKGEPAAPVEPTPGKE